jgi:hypothetical protein
MVGQCLLCGGDGGFEVGHGNGTPKTCRDEGHKALDRISVPEMVVEVVRLDDGEFCVGSHLEEEEEEEAMVGVWMMI